MRSHDTVPLSHTLQTDCIHPSNSGYCTKQTLWGFHPPKKCFQTRVPLNKSHRVPVVVPPHGQHPRAVSCIRMVTQTVSLWQNCLCSANFVKCQQRCPLQNTAGGPLSSAFILLFNDKYSWCVCAFSTWRFAQILPGYRRKCP